MNLEKCNIYLNYLLNKLNMESLDTELLLKVLKVMLEFIDENILQMMYTDLYIYVYENAYDNFYNEYIDKKILENIYKISKEDSELLLNNYIELGLSLVFKYVIPKRSYIKSHILINNKDNLRIKEKIVKLQNIIQPVQRSDEWYIFRNSTLTASNIYKIFVSDYSQTQLILEKCEPLDVNKFKVTNTNSPLHWGQKYEPVSILYYEYINNTKVSEFGCIPHSEYSYIAASPDGIVCDSNSKLFGRMLEIKNVVSREITGIPKMEYWIQMQLQMEVCNLNECDFLEMKFIEYTNEEEYLDDNDVKYKGIILQYLKEESPYYVYAPFMLNDLNSESYKVWEDNEKNKNKDYEFIKRIYWKIEKISNILVLRNKLWFKSIQPLIEDFWNILVYERESGKYKERQKNKRKLQIEDEKSRSDFPVGGCLIDNSLFKTDVSKNNCLIDNSLFKTEENLVLNIDTEISS